MPSGHFYFSLWADSFSIKGELGSFNFDKCVLWGWWVGRSGGSKRASDNSRERVDSQSS